MEKEHQSVAAVLAAKEDNAKADELVDKAVDMGYLTAQGQITISLDSTDQAWIDSHSQTLQSHLQTHMEEIFIVQILVEPYHDDDDDHWDDKAEKQWEAARIASGVPCEVCGELDCGDLYCDDSDEKYEWDD